ncbi:MAG: type II/IV secretion system ATPase subunit [Candidatus Woesearchaeota archaeon]
MVQRRHAKKTEDFALAQNKHAHLRAYVQEAIAKHGEPEWQIELDRSMKSDDNPNVLYPVGDPIFIHVYKEQETGTIIYNVIEPRLNEEEEALMEKVMDRMIEHAHKYEVPQKIEDAGEIIQKIYEEVVKISDHKPNKLEAAVESKIHLTQQEHDNIWYYVYRNRVGYGKLEPLFYDPYLEDIHCTGVGNVKTIHKIFEMVHTNIEFRNDLELDKYILDSSERVERPVSDANSVVDAIMPDGSRVNFIYGRELSLEGSSFTIRKFSEVPVSIIQIIKWGTMSAELAAYLWLAIENGMNIFVCGETASGKTTTLNAASTFIKPEDKVYSVENTPEVTMPHKTWQHLVTRESGKDTDVTIFDLLIAALRSRPNYIIVGEIRGEEGNVAFQAMQTGHPVMSTFHAGSPHSMIQRLTGHPINVPIASIDNLNIVLIQQAVSHKGKRLRRVLSVTEIERYYDVENKVITREVFNWDAVNDEHRFRGLFNSYILEKKIASALGYEDTRDIYNELERRTKILQKMAEEDIEDYFDVWDTIATFEKRGEESLPFIL